MIMMRGPISVAEFMRHALTHPSAGYYTCKPDVFGARGDFVTSPDISALFGEMLAIWLVMAWESIGSPGRVRLVEVGPGRGTLMVDMLRAIKQFPALLAALQIDFVEISPVLEAEQFAALQCKKEGDVVKAGVGIPVAWHRRFNEVGVDLPVLVVAHELFDALPVHQFQLTKNGWKERLVDVDTTTPLGDAGAGTGTPVSPDPATDVDSGLRLVLAPSPTPAAAAYSRLLSALSGVAVGDVAEFSPACSAMAFEIATKIGVCNGAGLVIDYGRTTPLGASVRGIRSHKFVDFLAAPGETDLSADVDFAALARAVESTGMAQALGPVDQGVFLQRMGIGHRLEALVNRLDESDDETYDRLLQDVRRLLAPDAMGVVYKAMCIVRGKGGVPEFVPPGFEAPEPPAAPAADGQEAASPGPLQ